VKAQAAEEGDDEEGGKKGKKDKDAKGKKPSSKLAAALREEQERRALEERAAQTAADLTEEARRLYRSLEVLGLGERALKRLDSTEVSKEVEELVGRAEAAVEDFPGFEGIAKVDAIIAELQACAPP
jgi:hypothetical protein